MDKSVAEIAEGLIPLLNSQGPELEPWACELNGTDRARIYHAHTGASFCLWGSRFDARVEISGRYPSDGGRLMTARDWGVIRYSEALPKITFGRGRELEAVARDIRKRFLSAYLPLYAACVERQRERGDYRMRRDDVAEALAEATGANVWRFQGEADSTPRVDVSCGQFEVRSADSVQVTLNVTGEFALKLAAWLRDNS
jgi:hypothetical protein